MAYKLFVQLKTYIMKKITFIMFALLGIIFTSSSQVQIGSGNNNIQNVPFNIAKNYSYGQSIYLHTEINATGTISTIQWYYAGTVALANSQGLEVYMGTTTKSNFTSIADWIPSSQLTQVYSGGITTDNSPGWKTITLSTPFVYNGSSNLVIAVNETLAGNDGATARFNSTQTSSVRSIDSFSNSAILNVASPPTTGTSISLSSFVPNIKLGGLTQTCITPITISYTDLSQTAVTLNWENQNGVAPANSFDIYVKLDNNLPTSSDVPTFTSSGTNFTVTNLLPNTQYFAFIRANCSSTEASAFSEFITFRTPCTAVTSLIEGFEETTLPDLPNCWTKILRGPSLATAASVKLVATPINLSAQSVALANSTSTGTYDILLVSPYLSNIASANNRLEFYAKGTGNLEIGTLNSADENAVFTVVQEVQVTSTTSHFSIAFDNNLLVDHYIGFRLNTSSTNKTTNIDDIRWEPIPTCPDDVSEITVPAVTQNSATFNYINSGSVVTSWDIAVGPVTTNDPSTLTSLNTLTNGEYTVNNLTSDTAYKVWIRSSCGTDKGSWRGPVQFRTDCDAELGLIENFDTTTALTLTSCWSKIVRGDFVSANANVRVIALNPLSGANSLQLSNSNSTGSYDVIAVSPRLSSLSLGLYRLKFQAKGVGVLEIGTVNTSTDSGEFNFLTSFNTTANYAEYVFDFSGYIGTDPHFGIRLASATTNSTVYVDNVIWEVAPLCPDVIGISVNDLLANTATINWDENTTVPTWNIAIGTSSDTDPSVLPVFTSTTQGAYNATNLEANTNYKVWVRSVCGVNNGSWIGPIAFQTNCNAVTTFSENFDTLTVPNLPNCWSKIIRGTTVSTSAVVATSTLANTQSAPNAARLFNSNSTGTYDIILVSPLMGQNLVNGSRVKFYAKSLTASSSLEVVTLNSNSATAAYTVIETIELNSTMSSYIVNLSGAAPTDSFVGFRLNATTGYQTIYLDTIIMEPTPSCIDVTDIAVLDIAATTSTVNWTASGTEASWDIVLGTTSDTDPSTLTPVLNTTSNNYFLDNLTASTTYKVWVRSVCSTENGSWIGPILFSTSCNPTTTINENFDTTPTLTLPLCWNSILRNGAFGGSDISVSTGGSSLPNAVTLYAANTSAGADIILVSPALNNINGNQILSFKASGSNNIQVGTLNSNASDALFTVFQSYTLTESFQTFTLDFATYTGTDTHIGFKIVTGSTTTSSQYVGIDDISWEPNLSNADYIDAKSVAFPNPVNSILNISSIKELTSITVYNIMGQQVLNSTENLTQLNMSDLSNGSYFVKLNGATFTETLKVIKN